MHIKKGCREEIPSAALFSFLSYPSTITAAEIQPYDKYQSASTCWRMPDPVRRFEHTRSKMPLLPRRSVPVPQNRVR